MKEKQDHTDENLIMQYRENGDMEIPGILFSRYRHLVYGVCLKYLKERERAMDAAMHVFEKLTESLREHEVDHFKSWLFVTTRNFCLMELRKKSIENASEEFSENIMEISGHLHLNDEEDEDPDKRNPEKLKKCMEELKEEQKICIDLFYLQSKSYREIEQITRHAIKKVKSYIQNGKRNLKICLESNNG